MTQPRQLESIGQVESGFFISTGFIFVQYAATNGGCDADDQIQSVFPRQLLPGGGQGGFIPWRRGQCARIMNTITIEKDAVKLMTIGQQCASKAQGGLAEAD